MRTLLLLFQIYIACYESDHGFCSASSLGPSLPAGVQSNTVTSTRAKLHESRKLET